MTCWRRLRDWQADGTWDEVHKVLLAELRGADVIDRSRALIDSSPVRAAYGGGATGPSPVDRGKPGSKPHPITDANGIPLASSVTAANVNDITESAHPYNKIPPVAGEVGHPRKEPEALQGDLASDPEPHRQGLRELGVEPVLPEKGIDDQSGLGETRWPIERTPSRVHRSRRLRIRYERRPGIHQASLTLACIKICSCALYGGFCWAVLVAPHRHRGNSVSLMSSACNLRRVRLVGHRRARAFRRCARPISSAVRSSNLLGGLRPSHQNGISAATAVCTWHSVRSGFFPRTPASPATGTGS